MSNWTARVVLPFVLLTSAVAQQGWWMTEQSRWVQTNLRQSDASLDAKHLVGQLADMRANVLLFGMGGIAAYYPTKVPFHYASPDLPAGQDMFGEVLNECQAKHPAGWPLRLQQDPESSLRRPPRVVLSKG